MNSTLLYQNKLIQDVLRSCPRSWVNSMVNMLRVPSDRTNPVFGPLWYEVTPLTFDRARIILTDGSNVEEGW